MAEPEPVSEQALEQLSEQAPEQTAQPISQPTPELVSAEVPEAVMGESKSQAASSDFVSGKGLAAPLHQLTACAVCAAPEAHELPEQACVKPAPSWRLLDVFWGLKMVLLRPELRSLALWPVVISLGVLSVSLLWGYGAVHEALTAWLQTSMDPGWGRNLLSFLLGALGLLGVGLLFGFLFLPVLGLISIPFLEPLAARLEKLLQPAPYAVGVGLSTLLREIAALTLAKLLLLGVALLGLLIPLLGPLLFTFLMAVMLSLDFLDVIWMRKGYRFQQKLEFLSINRRGWLLFLLPLMLMVWLPLLQILILPAATAGAVRFFLQAEKP